jgi:urease accessory protein
MSRLISKSTFQSQNARAFESLKPICAVQMKGITMPQTTLQKVLRKRVLSRVTTHNSRLMKGLSTKSLSIVGGLVGAIATLTLAAPALAHHPFGGQAPKTIFEGIVSGIGHPILGLDHFAFIIAVGFLAAALRRGVTVPLAFLLAALTGTGLHLSAVTLPAPELVISGSVLLFGLLLVTRRPLSTPAVVALTAFVGMFHGYAYGEAVVGAEPTPLVAYLIGFTLVQGAIAGVAYLLSQRTLVSKLSGNPFNNLTESRSVGIIALRQAGFVLCGAGTVFLGNLLV